LIAEFDWLSNCFLIEVENFGQFDDANVFMFEVLVLHEFKNEIK